MNPLSTRRIATFALGLSILFLSSLSFTAQNNQSADRIWQFMVRPSGFRGLAPLASRLSGTPARFQIVRLDRPALMTVLNAAAAGAALSIPGNTTPQRPTVQITFPMPDRTFVHFRVQEAPIMDPELERQFPGFKSYRGQGVEDPTMTVRFDNTPFGIHVIVLSPDHTSFIDPYPQRAGDLDTYVSFYKEDYQAPGKNLECQVGQDSEGSTVGLRGANRSTPTRNGEYLRTYRLAVAATGEYTQFHGGTVADAFAGIYTTISRVNAIYETELAISLRLIGDETKIIYTDPDTDPYTNSSASKLVSENEQNLDHVIGADKYDIGHVFSVGGGGLASLRSVGRNGFKARGATGSKRPVGDAFDVDYVAHEMGHQFGANHTFNAITGSCSNNNRNPKTAYEPGSGSTIMAYAGICAESDLQSNSHSYFHVASLEEIVDYITSAEVISVPLTTPTNNHPPNIVSGEKFTIPQLTPFALRATGTDLDGDLITYSWEEFDLGEPSPPEDDLHTPRPILRSFPPAKSAVRSFPRIENLIFGRQVIGESLPTQERVMTFRVTARDNHAGGGGISYAATTVVVTRGSGPFVVTQPDAGTVRQGAARGRQDRVRG